MKQNKTPKSLPTMARSSSFYPGFKMRSLSSSLSPCITSVLAVSPSFIVGKGLRNGACWTETFPAEGI